jgi:chromate transporter
MMGALPWVDALALFGNFLMLSLLTNGSSLAAAPDIHRMMVTNMGLVSDGQFSASIAIAHAAPGPNVLFVASLGYQAAGMLGAAVTLLGMLLPSTTLAYAAAHWGRKRGESRALRAFRAGTAPIVIALPLATGWMLAPQAPAWGTVGLTVAAALFAWLTRVHLLVLIAAGAAIGAAGLI